MIRRVSALPGYEKLAQQPWRTFLNPDTPLKSAAFPGEKYSHVMATIGKATEAVWSLTDFKQWLRHAAKIDPLPVLLLRKFAAEKARGFFPHSIPKALRVASVEMREAFPLSEGQLQQVKAGTAFEEQHQSWLFWLGTDEVPPDLLSRNAPGRSSDLHIRQKSKNNHWSSHR